MEYQKIERVVYLPGTKRLENDVEHSYGLAMLAWYLVTKDKLPLDINTVLKYALVHDFVEVYAGDTYLYDSEARATKAEREHAAAKRLREEHEEFSDLHDLIEQYEAQNDPESKFIKALDKIHPLLISYLDEGEIWREKGMSLEMMIEAKQVHVDLSPEVKPYFDSMVKHLRTRPELFEGERGKCYTKGI